MIVSAAWIGPAVFAVINRIAQARLQGWEPATLRELLFEFGDWLLYAFLTPGVFAVSRKWPLARPHLVRRAVLHFFFSLLFCVAWATCGQVLRFDSDQDSLLPTFITPRCRRERRNSGFSLGLNG